MKHRIRITAVPRKPVDVAGLASALSDLAAHIRKREAKQKRRSGKVPRERDDD